MTADSLDEAYNDDDLLALLITNLPSEEHIERESDFSNLIKERVAAAEQHLAKARQIRAAEIARDYAETVEENKETEQ